MPRNMTDEQIKAAAAGGGIVMVNVSSMFLNQKSIDGYLAGRQALMPPAGIGRRSNNFGHQVKFRSAMFRNSRAKSSIVAEKSFTRWMKWL